MNDLIYIAESRAIKAITIVNLIAVTTRIALMITNFATGENISMKSSPSC